MWVSRWLLCSALLCNTAYSTERVPHERREVQLEGLTKGPKVERHAIIPVKIALLQSNVEYGYDYLMEVSHPASARYGKHWSHVEVSNHFAPSKTAINTVVKWLTDNDIAAESISEDGSWLSFEASAQEVSTLLQTEIQEYHVLHDNSVRIGCEEYFLPPHVAEHIDFTIPGVALSAPLRVLKEDVTLADALYQTRPLAMDRRSEVSQFTRSPPPYGQLPPDLQQCGFNITAACLRALYSLPKLHAAQANNSLGLLEFDDAFLQSDLNAFFAQYAPDVPNGTHPSVVSINGGVGEVSAPSSLIRAETEVDVEVAYSLIYPQTVTVYELAEPGVYTFVDPFLDAIDSSYCSNFDKSHGFQCTNLPLTKVLSTSRSSPEIGLSVRAVRRACNEFMKLSLQGHTIIFNSGDYGVASNPPPAFPHSDGCIAVAANGTFESDLPNARIFNPQFPSVCPYVLSVGGTMLYPNDTVFDEESALNIPTLSPYPNAQFSSAGGFSNYVRRPTYQEAAIETYLKYNNPGYPTYVVSRNGSGVGANGGRWSRYGRGIPDVSANGNNFLSVVNATDHAYHGTSISAPIWASVITLLNEDRAKVGKSPVGFVNAVLYAHPEVFQDITNGTNPGCGTPGFAAAKGWDPVTGLGTPNYEKLRQLFLRLP